MSGEMEDLIKLIDYALASDNPTVKKALRNLLLVVSITEPVEDNTRQGPLAGMQRDLSSLRSLVNDLHNKLQSLENKLYGGTRVYPSTPSYPNTSYPYYPNTWITSTSSSSTGKTSSNSTYDPSVYQKKYYDTISNHTYDVDNSFNLDDAINKLLKDNDTV